MPIHDSQPYADTIERARFFQTVQTWPLTEDLNYDGWLANFKEGEERQIACSILDFFTHYSAKMVNQMLKTSVSNAGYIFVQHFSDWEHRNFFDRCFYSFIPGETLNPTDSGHIFTRTLRDVMNVPEERIVSYQYLPDYLDRTTVSTPIIFVDDFVGSGAQVHKAWNVNTMFSSTGRTLGDICLTNNHCAVYAPLIVNNVGYNVISSHCTGLHLCATHILGPEYNIFNSDCICWKNDASAFKAGTELIIRKSNELGIPSTRGAHVNDEKGFQSQGLAISFNHGAPDAIPPIFYWKENWTPLIQKQYDR